MGEDAEKAGKHKVGIRHSILDLSADALRQVGDRVGAEAMFGACGKCPDCKTFGDATYCTDLQGSVSPPPHEDITLMHGFRRMVGINRDGGFAEYCIIDSRTAAKLPDSLSFAQCAPLMCAGVTIYNSIKKAEACGLKPGGTIGFSGIPARNRPLIRQKLNSSTGLGALGHLGVQMAKVKVGLFCKKHRAKGLPARSRDTKSSVSMHERNLSSLQGNSNIHLIFCSTQPRSKRKMR